MNILITGAGGQLGRTFRDVAANGEHKCFFTDIREGEGITSLDVTDFEAVMSFLQASDADVIVNCAAYTNVDGAESDEEAARIVNVEAPKVLAEAARRKGATLVHISTDYVFDGKSYRPYTEDDAPAPVSVYGRTKLEGEKAVVASGCKYVIFRTAWLYSRYGRNFFLTMADKTAELPVIKVVEDQIGTPTYALDLAELIYNNLAVFRMELPWINVINPQNSAKEKDLTNVYGIEGFPTYIILNKEGKIHKKYLGAQPDFYKELDTILE